MQSAEELARLGIDIHQPRERATRICCKVLADESHAYVESANFLAQSKMADLECGLMVESPVVTSITTLMEAVLETFSITAMNELLRQLLNF